MNNTEGDALYQKAKRFSEEDTSVAGLAAREFANTLAMHLKKTQFNSGNFYDDALSFLSIKASKLNSLDNNVIIQFLEQCQAEDADTIVERFVDICTSPWFEITVKRLSFLGEQLATNGFNNDGARCFDRAKEIVLNSKHILETQN